MVFSDEENRGQHGQPGPDRTGGQSEADSTLAHSRGGEARSLSAGCEGARAGLGDGQEPTPPAALSLDTCSRESTKPRVAVWSRKQRRAYHRVRSFMAACAGRGWPMLFMTLTTAPGGDGRPLAYDVKRLLQKVERELGFNGLVHYMVQTLEGNGVAHLILGWGPSPGERSRDFWIPQRWLAEIWLEIHGARVVDVRAVRKGRPGWSGLARYLIGQYVAGQEGMVRLSWSWRRLFGFPLVQVWKWWRHWYRGQPFREMVRAWDELMAGGEVHGPPAEGAGEGLTVSLESIRMGWRSFASSVPPEGA